MVNDDRDKFKLADQDRDGFLNVLEYASFLYPHSHPHMHFHEVQRVLRDLDKDNDTFLTFDEYMGACK